MISDVIWHRLARIEEKLAESKLAYDQVDEPRLIEAMETIEQLTREVLRLARRQPAPVGGLRIVRPPQDDES